MFGIKDRPARTLVAGLFWEPFDAAKAETALFRSGFADHDIEAIGVLSGRAPDFSGVLFAMGMTQEDAMFYNDCLTDGGVLVIVRTDSALRANIASRALKQHGGILAPRKEAHQTMSYLGKKEEPRSSERISSKRNMSG
jgi:hypothetical protein